MSESVLDLIIADHRRIEILCDRLNDELQTPSTDPGDLEQTFTELKAMVKSHAKAEEMALYSLYIDAEEEEEQGLKTQSLEGLEEHQIIDRLMREMDELEFNDDRWTAKFTVLNELLRHHLREEEEDFIPEVKDALESEELNDLGALYSQQQQELFRIEAAAFGRTINPDIESLRG